ncbi:ABC transporter permease [Parablautia sp. Marseille-Q6255]|uniref:ABC transporter permease n=1 Tax=Parablautia sp. Marseille-Q6255 TaxID=3039593 RepID=UPI0024BC7C22|nr:ABC transporter permease [Parablautia sp. Marseille-Q6255]
MDMITYITNFIYSLIRISTPIIFIALGSAISQQGGILNMAAEAMMLTASLAGVMFSAMFQNVWLGILCGMGSAVLLALFLCFASFVMKVDMYLMSISLNMALLGGTVFVVYLATGTKNTTAGVVQSLSLGNINIPIIQDIPIIGAIFSGHNLFTYIALAMVFVVWFLLFRTKLGLRIRACGQNPAAAESIGINPRKIYTLAFVFVAAIGSLGGMYLSMGYQNFFVRNITANRGFIGLAAATIANGMPIGSFVMSLVFGLAYAITNYLKPYIVDSYFLSALPFLLIIILYFIMSAYRAGEEGRRLKAAKKKLAEASTVRQQEV